MSDLNEAVIISATRTPVGKFLGSLKGFSAPQLGAIVVREAVFNRNGLTRYPAVIKKALVESMVPGSL